MSRPRSDLAHTAHMLLDTIDGDTLVFAGRDDQEESEGEGLRIAYDGTGMTPSLRLMTRDGEVELRGETEITRVTEALKLGRRMAKAFGDPLSEKDWLRLQLGRP